MYVYDDIIRIPYAQPSQVPPYSFGVNSVQLPLTLTLSPSTSTAETSTDTQSLSLSGLYMCGDHVGTATLNGGRP